MIGSVDYTFNVKDEDGLGPLKLENLIRIDGEFSEEGDSGSALINKHTEKMVGMILGGAARDSGDEYTVCQPYQLLKRVIPDFQDD